jgi:hypothetical protein
MKRKPTVRVRQLPVSKREALLKTETGRTLQSHELSTLLKLLQFGQDIFCQIEANLPYTKVADIVWQNEQWEVKGITGHTRYTVRNNLRKARRQSANIVLDISGSTIKMSSAINQVKDMMSRNKQIRKVLVIDQDTYCIIDKSVL